MLEDYILADATPAREQNRLPDRPIAEAGPATCRPIAGLASGRMYKVTKIEDGRLKELVGKRVEITGTIKPDTDAKPADRATNTNLPNIEGTSIREVAGAIVSSDTSLMLAVEGHSGRWKADPLTTKL